MIWFLSIWSLISLGLMSLACSMSKHQKQIFSQELSSGATRFAQYLGWVLLAISISVSLYDHSISVGLSYWLGVATFASLFVAAMLSYFHRYFKTIAQLVAALSLITVSLSLIGPVLSA